MNYLTESKTFAPLEATKIVSLLEANKAERNVLRNDTRGYSKDRSKRLVARFPAWIVFHPEYKKYFDPEMDKHEAAKALRQLSRLFPEFFIVDKR